MYQIIRFIKYLLEQIFKCDENEYTKVFILLVQPQTQRLPWYCTSPGTFLLIKYFFLAETL
jgi:hypothetical protein